MINLMLELTSFQAKLLANFFSDVAKGALLSALGFMSWALNIAETVEE